MEKSGEGLRLLDMAGLVFGYGLASLLARAFFSTTFEWTPFLAVAAALIYLWLGLAMSGPIVLTFDRLRRNPQPIASETGPATLDDKRPRVRHTRAELCWLLIGSYWLVMTGFLAGYRVPGMSWPLLFVVPGLAILLLGVATLRRSPRRVTPARAWTHWAAYGLVATWPVVWVLLIVLATSLL